MAEVEANTAPEGAALEQQAHHAVGKRVLRKIDIRLVPLMFTTYMFNFMDKTILSSASVFGLSDDTVQSLREKCEARLMSTRDWLASSTAGSLRLSILVTWAGRTRPPCSLLVCRLGST